MSKIKNTEYSKILGNKITKKELAQILIAYHDILTNYANAGDREAHTYVLKIREHMVSVFGGMDNAIQVSKNPSCIYQNDVDNTKLKKYNNTKMVFKTPI